MHRHRHGWRIRLLLSWLMAGILFLPFSALGGIHCGEDLDGAPSTHCQRSADRSLVANDDSAVADACCCHGIFHALGCQHHCQAAGHASLITASPCPVPLVGQVWAAMPVTAIEESFLEPPYHPPRS